MIVITGPVQYMSPEALRDPQFDHTDPLPSEVWAFGGLCVEVLSEPCTSLFQGVSDSATVNALVTGKFPPILSCFGLPVISSMRANDR